MFCRKFHLQAVRGCCRFPTIECRSPYDGIVGQGEVNREEVKLLSCLKRVQACYNCQCYYPLQVHLVSTETDEGGLKWTKILWVYFQLLEDRKVNHVSQTLVIHQDSSSVESFYHENDDQGVVVQLLDSSSIFF